MAKAGRWWPLLKGPVPPQWRGRRGALESGQGSWGWASAEPGLHLSLSTSGTPSHWPDRGTQSLFVKGHIPGPHLPRRPVHERVSADPGVARGLKGFRKLRFRGLTVVWAERLPAETPALRPRAPLPRGSWRRWRPGLREARGLSRMGSDLTGTEI